MPPSSWSLVTVRPRRAVWLVERVPSGGSVVASEHETKEQAVWHARQYAQRARPCRLIVYRADGTEEQLFNYGAEKPQR